MARRVTSREGFVNFESDSIRRTLTPKQIKTQSHRTTCNSFNLSLIKRKGFSIWWSLIRRSGDTNTFFVDALPRIEIWGRERFFFFYSPSLWKGWDNLCCRICPLLSRRFEPSYLHPNIGKRNAFLVFSFYFMKWERERERIQFLRNYSHFEKFTQGGKLYFILCAWTFCSVRLLLCPFEQLECWAQNSTSV